MASIALSASAALLPLKRNSGAWSKLFPFSSKSYLSFKTCRKNRFISFAASNSSGRNGDLVVTSEDESASQTYAWPDKKSYSQIGPSEYLPCRIGSLSNKFLLQKPRICILGGGFGGLYTALRLESLVWQDDKKPQVLLVDQSERFVFKPMLYELLSGEVDAWEIAPRFADLLANTGVQFFKDRVKLLCPSDHLGVNGPMTCTHGGTVLLESGLIVEYDWLVLSLGAEPKLDVVPGAAEFAFPFSTLEDACRVDRKLSELERRNFGKDSLIRVAVVGCGYSGVELAATVSERLEEKGIVQAINVETTICPTGTPGNREAALKVRNLDAGSQTVIACLISGEIDLVKLSKIWFPTMSAALVFSFFPWFWKESAEDYAREGFGFYGRLSASLVKTVLSARKVQLVLGYFVRCIRRVGEFEASVKLPESRAIPNIAADKNSDKYILELQPAIKGLESQIFEADLVLWTVGSKPLLPHVEPPNNRFHDLPLNARGQAETDETLRVKGHPRIFALGDSSALRDSSGRPLPATAQFDDLLKCSSQVAFQQADFAGWNLWAAINDRPLLPFRFQNLGEMMILGRNDAAVSPSFVEGVTLDGPIGHSARKLAYLIRLPTDEHRLKVGVSWLTKSAIDSVALLQSTLTKVFSSS
ncbi:hypothetical protein WN944_023053 [Citrus x changshan-huyou]|uniref:FAD/NAD(P)-binding domain-containing protein n=1 Tax=Citrus x changshan-huyou TaxID=2935761 RepID=A0AAP0R3I8_9ROSI